MCVCVCSYSSPLVGTFWGVQVEGTFAFEKLISFGEQFLDIHVITFALGVASIFVLVAIELTKRRLSRCLFVCVCMRVCVCECVFE